MAGRIEFLSKFRHKPELVIINKDYQRQGQGVSKENSPNFIEPDSGAPNNQLNAENDG